LTRSFRRGFEAAAVAIALVFVAAVALTSCSLGGTASPSQPVSPSFPGSPIDGVVVAVDSAGLGNVHGFMLRIPGGATIQLTLGALENAAQFAPGHLAEHEASGTPVRVSFVVSGGVPTVYRIEDAPAAPSSSP